MAVGLSGVWKGDLGFFIIKSDLQTNFRPGGFFSLETRQRNAKTNTNMIVH